MQGGPPDGVLLGLLVANLLTPVTRIEIWDPYRICTYDLAQCARLGLNHDYSLIQDNDSTSLDASMHGHMALLGANMGDSGQI